MTYTKTIFQLRREGNTDRAFELARELYAHSPDDMWVVRAYGWVLYDKLKAAQANNDTDEADNCAELLINLNVGENDEMLCSSIQRLLARRNPRERLFAEASQYDYSGEHEKALQIFRQISLQYTPSEMGFHNAYGWTIYKYLKSLIKNEAGGADAYQQLVEEYFGLRPEKPSALNSMMLVLALQQFKDNAQIILKWQSQFSIENFRSEDFESYEKEGKKYPGLAERATQIIAKVLLLSGTKEQTEQFQPMLDAALSKTGNNIWLYYYKAKMLVKTGKAADAEAFLLPVVRQKRSEYWVWALLGDIYTGTDRAKAISCYCKALTCKAEEKYLINTRMTFGRLLQSVGYFSEAKTEIELSLRSRLEAGYSVLPSVMLTEHEDWYKQATSNESNLAFYKNNLSLAEAIVFGELPWLKGNLVSTYLRPDDHKKHMRARILLLNQNNASFYVSVRVAQYGVLKNMAPGDGLTAMINENEGQSVVEIAKREVSEKFDMVEGMVGVVDHVNQAKGITHVLISKEIDTLIFGGPIYAKGDFVEVKVVTKEKGGQLSFETLAHKSTTEMPSMQICQPYSGKFRLNSQNTAGRVQTVNIGKDLVQQYSLARSNGETIGGLAVNTYNRFTDKWEWRAVTIESQPVV